jgi:photosystem II stability/assembly factor-like uncharacterized protein
MKRTTKTLLLAILALNFLIVSCQKENKESNEDNTKKVETFKEKKRVRDTSSKHIKGIERMADYQLEIRKNMDDQKPTYEKGYLMTEYTKAKQNSSKRKSATSLNPTFIERGPVNVPGRTRGIAVHPNDNKTWFVGTVSGGVWKTEDEGVTWTNLTDNLIPNLSTSTIVISPQDGNTLYVGTGEPFGNLGAVGGSGLFKTTDGGATWTTSRVTAAFGDIGRIIINPTDKNNVIVAAENGIYRTVNGGGNWVRTYNSPNTVQDLDVDPTNFNIQYGSVLNLGLVKSVDGGQNWTVVLDRADFNTNHSRFETSVSAADPNTVFVSVYTPGTGATTGVNTDFYVSRNKGGSFALLSPSGSAAAANLLTGQGWYDNIIMAHPFDVNSFYVGGVAVFKVTITSGTSFTSKSIASGYDRSQINTDVHVDQHGLTYIPGPNQTFRILLGNDGGIYSTSFKQNPGFIQGDWSAAVVGKNSTQFYGAAKQNGADNYLAGAQDNGTWLSQGNSTDKSTEYTFVFGGDGFEVLWHYDKPGSFLVTSQNTRVGRYENFTYQGVAEDIVDDGIFYSKLSNADNNPDAVFTVTQKGVWRSIDFGKNWELISIPVGFLSTYSSTLNVEVSTADPSVVWAGGAMRQDGSVSLHVSQDNGQSFSQTNSFVSATGTHSFNISGIGTSLTERNRAYALFSGNGAAKVLKTEDLGATWTDISGFSPNTRSGFPNVAVHSILEMPFDKDIIWVGTDIGIFETTNGGTNWTIVDGFIPVAVYDMKIVNDQVVISSYGRGVWSATLAQLESYTLPSFLTTPTITSAQKDIQSLKTLVNYNVTDDNVNRVKIFIDGVETAEVVQNFDRGISYTYETADLSEGTHKFGIKLFVDSNSTESPLGEKDFEVIEFKPAAQSVGISEFSMSDVYVYSNTFKTDNVNNTLTNSVLNNADHPYLDNTTYTTLLRQPLTITEANKNFTYEDVAIVEPYTDDLTDLSSFYDYVIIEASSDLQTWKTLDKYDARRFPEWLDEFNRGADAAASDALFKSQTIVLTNKGFSIGETVVFRFRLVSDPGANSFGWAIRSIEESVASIDDVINDLQVFSVYPTISKGNFTVFAKNTLGKSKLQVFNMNGKAVYLRDLDFNTNEKQEINMNVSSGIYFVQIVGENNKKATSKIIIE